MSDTSPTRPDGSPSTSPPGRTTPSPPSSPGLLSKLPFIKGSADGTEQHDGAADDDDEITSVPAPANATAPARSLATVIQQQKTRRRRGSLRKAALLGRGAQRDRRDSRSAPMGGAHPLAPESALSASAADDAGSGPPDTDALGLAVPNSDPPSALGGFTGRSSLASLSVSSKGTTVHYPDREGEGAGAYASTTDEDDVLQISHSSSPSRSGLLKPPGSDSYFANRETGQRPRSFQQAKSPLSYSGLSTTTLPAADSDWDYSETEWWGWVVLCVTWFVFVIGMGSCFDVWSWAWDVGKTPYAPPELEDDPTLPLVGYYPALIILTGVMAWVWVVVAWVGMKYFRHAKISGD